MEITTRDVLTVIGMAFMGVAVYIALLQRVTRLEGLERRVTDTETDVKELQRDRGTADREMGELKVALEALGRRVLALEGAVDSGFDAVLAELRAQRRSGAPS